MSQSMMRKAQPFTIGTRLSTPKCPDLPTCGPGAEALDGASMSQNLSDRVSHYLAQANSSPCRFSPPQRRAVYSAGSMDDNNSSLARSIKKITLSRHKDATYREGTMRLSPRVLAKNSHGNFNNNNSRGLRHFSPDAIEIPCDWSVRNPWSVSTVECNAPATTYAKCPGILHDSTQGNSVKTAPTSGNVPTTRRPSLETDSAIAQLSLDIKQAEIWVRGKLQDLSDQCDIFPLQDWDRRALSIQGDISDFESTIMKLSQMGERLSRSQTSNAASIRTQLQALKDQWQLLKLTATNQNRAAGGAKALLEFNKKADELEIWMREKEENPPLSVLLDENFDKMQLTRRILDLKQDQLYYRNLQENINGLAQKLEKQGRAESKGTSNRRKHLNRMWLRLQTSLEEHHQSLQLALEAATLWQQADAILRAMEEKRSSATVRNGGCGDQDLRDIASQIMVLDITVSQVCSLHPVLASKALHKQRRVKESWTQLQQTVRKERSSRVTFTREPGSSVTTVSEDQSSVGNQAQRILGCQEAETNNRDYNIQNPLNSPPEAQTEKEIICVIPLESKRQDSSLTDREQTQGPHNGLLQRPPSSSKTEADHLLNELSSTTQWLQSVELLLSEPTAMRSPELVRRDLRQVSILEKEVKSRGPALHCLGGKARRLRVPDWTVSEETQVKVLEVEERFQIVQEALQRRASDLRDTLVLSEFMKVVQMEEERKKKEMPADGGSGRGEYGSCCVASGRTERFTPLEDLQEAVEMLNDAVKERERAVAASKEMTDLESRLLALSKMIASVRSRLQDVGRQVEAAEQGFTAVKKQTDLRDVQEMFIQQQQIEMDMFGAISEELRKLDEGRGRLQELCPTRSETVDSSIEEILQACSHLQGRIQENEARLQRTARLREFFLSYLGMISWTEDMRSQVLSESPGDRLVPGRREELEKSIEEKLKEFEVLAGIGWKLIGEDHRLSQMIKERLEELQGMLSWVLMRWRCQKQQRGNKAQRLKTTDVLEATKVPKDELRHTDRSIAAEAIQCPKDEDITQTSSLPRGPPLRRYRKKALSPMFFQHPLLDSLDMETEDGAELQEDSPRKRVDGPLWLEPKVLPRRSETPEPEEEPLMVTWKLDFQLMEGPLEKKPILQPGGKKASCRTWGVFYAVLVRRTLCFYHDRKHSTKSFVSSTPLNLTGAVCTQESDYAKRSNCFRLRLKDGSEYLFRAPTSELLQEWVSKVCHNSGLEDTDLLGNSVLGTNLTPCHVSRDDPLSPWKTNLCRPIPVQGRDMVDQPRQKEPQNVQADDCRSRTGPQLPSRFYVPENIGPEHDSNLTTYRRRSQSFSSVMYQKVTSFTNPQEISPSYSVTLYIDEPLTPRGRCHSFATSHREGHTSHTADLKPRNKSVFRKFFRKKE
ncbi:spectrin beta chain, non-erythrocytic 5-like isoform X2 [Pseudophryne corroboree]|uniref:spectrin beta chain, non-erythrocytic 5-like isoform X2 n=1 Tax=Pseudophryne corroboree TaxID=495146 RepID=UPI003081E6E3